MNLGVIARSIACLAASAGVATIAHTQPIESLTFSVVWDKSVIAPGETNTGAVRATIWPEIGTVTAWNTYPGTGQLGKLLGFAKAKLDLHNLANALEGTLAWSIAKPLALGSLGVPDGNGGISGASMWQHWQTLPSPNFDQSLDLLELTWTHTGSASTPFEVKFEVESFIAKVYLDVGLSVWIDENAVKLDGQGGFSVIPAPSPLWASGPIALAVTNRRRRR